MGNEKTIQKYQFSIIQLTLITGFVAGVMGAVLGYLANIFNFTEINPGLILTIFRGSWKEGWLGIVIATILYGLLSILVALLYYLILRKKKSLIWSAIFGIALFGLIYFVLYPLIPGIELLTQYDFNTIVTEFCLILLYGIFIGYSISYEYNEQLVWNEQTEK